MQKRDHPSHNIMIKIKMETNQPEIALVTIALYLDPPLALSTVIETILLSIASANLNSLVFQQEISLINHKPIFSIIYKKKK